LAVGLLWWLSGGEALLFSVPVLALADAVAALIGVRYGTVRYKTHDGFKSAEGSIAFFAVAFLSVHVPVLLAGVTGRAESLLLASIVGLLVMLIESIFWRGLDNMFVPLGAFAFLSLYLNADAAMLGWR
jgi:phytol kinase